MSELLLTARQVQTFYGKIQALKGVDIDIPKGKIVTLIGSNGAGKSTLMMTICGTPRARHGTIVFDGTDITNTPTHVIARMGISQSPEGRRIFPRMTVLENLQMGATLVDPKFFDEDVARAYTMFPILEKLKWAEHSKRSALTSQFPERPPARRGHDAQCAHWRSAPMPLSCRAEWRAGLPDPKTAARPRYGSHQFAFLRQSPGNHWARPR